MSKPKLTGWYPGEVKPCSDKEHIGPYQRDYSGHPSKDWWDGRVWRYNNKNGGCASWQERPWRGLTEPSK